MTMTDDCEREPHPSDSLRTFGAVVQALREHAGLSRVEFGGASGTPNTRWSRWSWVAGCRTKPSSSGRRRPSATRGRCGGPRAISPEARWAWRWFRRWARLEREAVSLCTYECRLVPGLLQSEAYARAVFDNSIPLLTDEQTEAQLAARMERQAMLRERPTVPFGFIVEESVFRRRFGGARCMRACSTTCWSSRRRAT